MSIYLTSSLPTPLPPYSHLDLNPDLSWFESGFPPNSDCQNTNEYLHPTQSMKICVSVCVYVAFIFDMAVTILLLVNKDEEEKYD